MSKLRVATATLVKNAVIFHWSSESGLVHTSGEIDPSLEYELEERLADWQVTDSDFGILNAAITIDEASWQHHPFNVALRKLFRESTCHIFVWKEGSHIHAIARRERDFDAPSLDEVLADAAARIDAGRYDHVQSVRDGADVAADEPKLDKSAQDGAVSLLEMPEADGSTAVINTAPLDWAAVKHVLATLSEEHVDEAQAIIAARKEKLERDAKLSVVFDMARKLFPKLAEQKTITDQDLTNQFEEASKRDPKEFEGEEKKLPYVDLVKEYRKAKGKVQLDGIEVRLTMTKPYKAEEKTFTTMLSVQGTKGVKTHQTPPALIFS